MAERIDGVVQGLKESLEAAAAQFEQAVLGFRHALVGAEVREARWLDPEQVIRTEDALYVHPITARMLRTGEDFSTASLAWKLDELEAWALRRHETRCNIAQRAGEARADRALALHLAGVERMRLRWSVADVFGVPVQLLTPMGAGGGWLINE